MLNPGDSNIISNNYVRLTDICKTINAHLPLDIHVANNVPLGINTEDAALN